MSETYDELVHGTSSSNNNASTDTGSTGTGGDTTIDTSTDNTNSNSSDLSTLETNTNNIDSTLTDISSTLNPSDDDLRELAPDNSLADAVTWFDTYVIPTFTEFITNTTNDFNSLKDTYYEKYTYFEDNEFTFNYESTLYETCAVNYELEILENTMNISFDICDLLSISQVPNSNLNFLSFFFMMFYSFFLIAFHIAIFKLSFIIFRIL